MPIDDELVRRLTMGGLDPHMAALVADKHSEQRVVKIPFDASTPHLKDGTLVALTLEPGDMLLGYLCSVHQTFRTNVRSVATAANAPALPVTVDSTHNAIGQLGTMGGPWIVANGVYATLQTLVDALNAATAGSGPTHHVNEVGAFSSSGGKLLFTAIEGGPGSLIVAGSHDIGLVAHLGFVVDVNGGNTAQTDPSVPQVYLLGPGSIPGDGNELATVDVWTAVDGTTEFGLGGLGVPAVRVGLPLGGPPVGYLDPAADPLPIRLALVNSSDAQGIDYPDPHLNGTGKGFLWFWVSSLF